MTGPLVYCEAFWALDCVGLRDPLLAELEASASQPKNSAVKTRRPLGSAIDSICNASSISEPSARVTGTVTRLPMSGLRPLTRCRVNPAMWAWWKRSGMIEISRWPTRSPASRMAEQGEGRRAGRDHLVGVVGGQQGARRRVDHGGVPDELPVVAVAPGVGRRRPRAGPSLRCPGCRICVAEPVPQGLELRLGRRRQQLAVLRHARPPPRARSRAPRSAASRTRGSGARSGCGRRPARSPPP